MAVNLTSHTILSNCQLPATIVLIASPEVIYIINIHISWHGTSTTFVSWVSGTIPLFIKSTREIKYLVNEYAH